MYMFCVKLCVPLSFLSVFIFYVKLCGWTCKDAEDWGEFPTRQPVTQKLAFSKGVSHFGEKKTTTC